MRCGWTSAKDSAVTHVTSEGLRNDTRPRCLITLAESDGRQDHQLERRFVVRLEACMDEAQDTFFRMGQTFLAGGRPADVVRLPPVIELRTASPETFEQVLKSRIARPQVVGGAKLCHQALRLITPRRAEELPHGWRGEQTDQGIAFREGELRKTEQCVGGVVEGEHVPATSDDVRRLVQTFDDSPHRGWHGFAFERGAIGMLSERFEVRMFDFAQTKRPSERVDGGLRGADAATLFEANVPIDANACEFRDFFPAQAWRATPPVLG